MIYIAYLFKRTYFYLLYLFFCLVVLGWEDNAQLSSGLTPISALRNHIWLGLGIIYSAGTQMVQPHAKINALLIVRSLLSQNLHFDWRVDECIFCKLVWIPIPLYCHLDITRSNTQHRAESSSSALPGVSPKPKHTQKNLLFFQEYSFILEICCKTAFLIKQMFLHSL